MPESSAPLGHVCLDLETLGLGLDSVIISVGAVHWVDGDPDGQFREVFDRRVDLNQEGRRIDPDTVLWWMRQDESARSNTFNGLRDALPLVRADLARWLTGLGDPLVWTHDPSFDAAMLKDAGGMPPWPYRNTRCCRTAADYTTTSEIRTMKSRLDGVAHTALYDAMVSGWQVQNFRNRTAGARAGK